MLSVASRHGRPGRLGWGVAILVVFGSACSAVDRSSGTEERPAATLRALAADRGLHVGAAVGTGLLGRDAAYARTLAREFNLVTPENAMKMGPLRPDQATFDFAPADAIVEYAAANDMAVRGHTLVWHNQLPTWVEGRSWSRAELAEVLEEHIRTVVGHYQGRVAAWDVVNEAVADDGSMRPTIWLETIGPEYVGMAFRWAHEADPSARLFYNDYGAEGAGRKSDAVFDLVRRLAEEDVPIHGVGMQMHVANDRPPRTADVAANMDRFGALGLEVHITEMDVRLPLPAAESELRQQASVYAGMMEVCLDAPTCSSFVLWGFTDRYSWIPSWFDGYGAALVFDQELEPKSAYDAMKLVLQASD